MTIPGGAHPIVTRAEQQCVYEDRGHDSHCLTFKGRLTRDGYGITREGLSVHRVMYEQYVGAIPDGMEIDHLCRQRDCCEPTHLEAVTRRENQLRGNGVSGINARRTHCIHGHEFTPENTYAHQGTGRKCKACDRDRKIASRARRRLSVA